MGKQTVSNRLGDTCFPNDNKWDFQIHAARKIVADCQSREYLGAVLASVVCSGKTQILIHAMNFIFEKHPKAKILYLAHAQDVIRTQTIEIFGCAKNPVKPNFTFGRLNSGCQVEVAIPQEVNERNTKSRVYNYLIVDEAHTWFSSKSVLEKIIQRLCIKKLILATGTASLFNS